MDAPQYGNLARDDLATQRGLTSTHALPFHTVYFEWVGIVPMA
jgi:hypothetical protein